MSRQTTKKRQQVRMGGPMGRMGTGEKAKDFKGAVKKLIKYFVGFSMANVDGVGFCNWEYDFCDCQPEDFRRRDESNC